MPDGELGEQPDIVEHQLTRTLTDAQLRNIVAQLTDRQDPEECIIRSFVTDYGIAAFRIAWEPAIAQTVATPMECIMEDGDMSTAELYFYSTPEFKAQVRQHFDTIDVPIQPIVFTGQ